MAEIWKNIIGYEGLYQVSNLGNVKSLNYNHTGKEKLLSKNLKNTGYYSVTLFTNGKRKEYRVHRLVAEAFIDNPNSYDVINHKDENKLNNNVDNLEWCTVSYNTKYSSYKWSGNNNAMYRPDVRLKQKKAVKNAHLKESIKVYDMVTNLIYNSVREAAEKTNISRYLIKHSDRFLLSQKGGDLIVNSNCRNESCI